MLKVGDKLPNVKLQGTQGGENKDFTVPVAGKNTVLVFFPFAFTPV